ncbi:HCLS1-associated protein X-1 isoform X2 [Colletes gigas]|uniref:HCLS1-associated protein X-1 isoform X2 n=1 Tax=Colletes gigas TaxID=935657 RepID=UPI001C9B9B90|nr:HCLS1-associated protein X-1 isoform X2 [Colletes gigas]
MPFWNFFHDIFSGKSSEEPRNDCFRNPIWQNDEDDDDVDDFRHSRKRNHFHIFSEPLEITRYFESQINEILKNFMFEFGSQVPGQNTFIDTFPFENSQQENLRDKMLKSSENVNQLQPKLDTDLDKEVTMDNFSNIWSQYSKEGQPEAMFPKQRIFGKSISKRFIHRPDGTIEQKQVIRDNEGNEETIISHQKGDKMYTVITKKDKYGVETKTENIVDIDSSESKKIEDKLLPFRDNSIDFNFGLNYFPWEKFFKPDPKL